MSIKLFVYDMETYGISHKSSGPHEISGMIVIDGEIVEKFHWNMAPFAGATVDVESLKISGKTPDDIKDYPLPKKVFPELLCLLDKYVNRYNPKDKFHTLGYNNSSFDDNHLRAFFSREENNFFGSYFYSVGIDVMHLAAQKLAGNRHMLPNMRLGTVADFLGLKIHAGSLHDSAYDVQLTWDVYTILNLI